LIRAVVLLLFVWFAIPARAQDVPSVDLAEEAELQFDLGLQAARGGDCGTALEHLLTSNRLVPNKNVVYNIARCYQKLEQFDQAYRHYSDYLALETDPARRAAAEAASADIAAKVALIEVVTDPPGATIYVDRKDLGPRGPAPRTLALPPGEHTILVELDGFESATSAPTAITIGGKATVKLALAPILGTVQVDGSPAGAEIRVDEPESAVVGTVPAALQLRPGPHVLIVTAPGHRSATQVATVAEKQTTRAVIDLALVSGTVVVNALERDALIAIDGEAKGFTPAVLSDVPAGDHVLRVTLSGFRPFEQAITVPADGQVTVDVRLRSLQEVTAASRTSEAIEDAPASVSLVTAQEIRAFGYQTLYDALAGTRGLYQSNDLTYQYIGVRGFSSLGDYGNRVLVTEDGHTLNDDQVGASYVGYDLMSDLLDIDRVEVVRGPGSALYGTNAFFGVVNLVTRDQDTMRPTHVSVAADGTRTFRASGGVSAKLGDDGGVWASVGGVASQGLNYTFPEYADAGEVVGADGQRAGTASAKLWKGDLTIEGMYNTRDKRIPTGAFESVLGGPRSHSQDSRGYLELRYEPKLGEKARLYARAYVDHYEFEDGYDYGEDYPNDWYHDTWRGTWAGVEPRLVATPGKALRLTVGAEARSSIAENIHGDELLGDDETPIATYLDTDPVQQVFSGYAVADVTPVHAVSASIGARADWFNTFGLSANPRAALILRPTSRDTVKALAGTAFRAPSAYETYYNDGGQTQIAAEDLGPETILSAEVEGTHRFSDVTTATISGYSNDIEHQIITETDDDGVLQYVNTDEHVRTLGDEVEVRRDWRQGWMFAVTGGFQRTRVGDPLGDVRVANSPEYLASLKTAAPLGGNGTAASRLRFESPRVTNDGLWTKPVLLWDLTATGQLAAGRVEWAIGVRNVLDWQVGYPGGDDVAQSTLPQPPRTLFAEVTAGF
jgi:outer membrane receptor for ferrienterochelin and colicins